MDKCSDVMTKHLVCGFTDDTVYETARLMKRENVGSIPIVEDQEKRKLIGIVTDRDLALKVVADGMDPKTTKVKDVMTRKVMSCKVDDKVQKAIDLMAEHQLRRIPVVESGDHLVGIIAQADIATRVDEARKTADMVKEISRP